MTAIISMLRGVNVGGHNLIKMETLRAIYESLKLREPQSYVQSGNVVFGSEERDLARLAERIEGAIERKVGFRPSVMLRTLPEMRDVVRRNPFAKRKEIDPRKLVVTFLPIDPGAETRDTILKIKADPEEVRIDGRELYIYFPNGMGRSKLTPLIERALKKSGTARNWNTVLKVLEMAEKLESSD